MKVVQLLNVAHGASGRIYASAADGVALFPSTKALGETLKVGQWANIVDQQQTKSFNDKGELVDLAEPVMRPIITAVFPDMMAAVKAIAQPQIFDAQVRAYAEAATKNLAEAYGKLTPEQLAATI